MAARDTGYSWVVCASSFMVMVLGGGFLYTTGMFYIMFKNGLDAGDTALSAITSLNVGMLHIISPVSGVLIQRFGERRVSMLGAVMSTAGLAASAFSTEVSHLYLVYGVITGVGLGMMLNPSFSILPKYFSRYNRTANGLASCGLGVGSFVFPPMIKALEDAFGWRGALLMMAGINAHALVFCALYKPTDLYDVKPKKCKKEIMISNGHLPEVDIINGDLQHDPEVNDKLCDTKGNNFSKNTECNGAMVQDKLLRELSESEHMIQPSNHVSNGEIRNRNSHPKSVCVQMLLLFRNSSFMSIFFCSTFINFPISIVYTMLGSYVLSRGFRSVHVVGIYMAMGISSTINRPLTGVIAQVTKANIGIFVLVLSIAAGLITLVVPLMNNLALLYVYVVLIQIFLAPYNTLSPVCVAESVPLEQFAVAWGIYALSCVPGLGLGAPLAAWLYEMSNVYTTSFYLAGPMMILSGLAMLPMSYNIYRQRKAERNLSVEDQ